MLLQAGVQVFALCARRELPQMQPDGQYDALAEGAVRGQEKRALRQPGVLRDLGRVFVLQLRPIDLEGGRMGCLGAFVRLHAGTPTAGVARHRMDVECMVGGQQAGLHQGP